MNNSTQEKKSDNPNKIEKTNKFFLACEFKPNSDLFSVLDPFVYDIEPAFIQGTLGILSYDPEAYSIISNDDKKDFLFGYLMTITHPDTILLLDKIKGYYGETGFNYHERHLAQVFTSLKKVQKAWIYKLSEIVLQKYETIEQMEFGIWDEEDKKLLKYFDKVQKKL